MPQLRMSMLPSRIMDAPLRWVLVFVAVILAMAGCGGTQADSGARLAKTRADLQAIVIALHLYRLENAGYPDNEQRLRVLAEHGRYLDRVPVDPWGNEYVYTRIRTEAGVEGFDLRSLGPDGRASDDDIALDSPSATSGDPQMAETHIPWVVIAIAAILGLILYFIPSVIALTRNHRNKAPIVALNILLGWSILGWVGALVWALVNDQKTEGEREAP